MLLPKMRRSMQRAFPIITIEQSIGENFEDLALLRTMAAPGLQETTADTGCPRPAVNDIRLRLRRRCRFRVV